MKSVKIDTFVEGGVIVKYGSVDPETRRYSTMAEAMVDVMEFLAPNQLHTVAAYLETRAEKAENSPVLARFGA